jgi:hypothetical protein
MGGDAGESSRAIETARYRDGRPGLRAYGDNERSSPRETVKFSMFRGYREPIATPLILLTATTWTVQRIGKTLKVWWPAARTGSTAAQEGVACFGLPPWKKIIGGVTARISFRLQRDGCSSLPCRVVLSFRSEAREMR